MLCDFHIHARPSSIYLIKESWIKKILDTAIKKKLDLIVIVDHNYLKAPLLAKELQEKLNLPIKVIPGVEISSIWKGKIHHIIALNVKKNILPYRNIKKIIKSIKKQDGSIILPHPSLDLLYEIHEAIDGVEVYNARHPVAYKELIENEKKFAHLMKTFGSDSHTLAEIGAVTRDIDPEYLKQKRILI